MPTKSSRRTTTGTTLSKSDEMGSVLSSSWRPKQVRLCSNNQLFLQKWDEANAAIDAQCSERLHRAHCVNSVFLLRALAAWKTLRQRKIQCCRAAGIPAIRAECSKDQRLNSQTAGLFGHPSRGRSDDSAGGGHGFGADEAEAFPAAGEEHDIAFLKFVSELLFADGADEVDGVE